MSQRKIVLQSPSYSLKMVRFSFHVQTTLIKGDTVTQIYLFIILRYFRLGKMVKIFLFVVFG